MLDRLIHLSLSHRVMVLLLAAALGALGLRAAATLPTDVLPDLTRPTVTVVTESPGLAALEVESLVTVPLESALAGAPGLETMRSSSVPGLSLVTLEFEERAVLLDARQLVQERLAHAAERLPEGLRPELGPISSLMGEIMLVGLSADTPTHATTPDPTTPDPATPPTRATDQLALRDLADFLLRPAFLAVPGVSQVTVIGGSPRTFVVEADPPRLRAFALSLDDLDAALRQGAATGGGVLDAAGQRLTLRHDARFRSREDLEHTLVALRPASDGHTQRAVLVRDVATVREGPPPPARRTGLAAIDARPGVILAVAKQPQADTRIVSDAIDRHARDLARALPPGVQLDTALFRQSDFIQRSIDNLRLAVRDGAILVVVVLAIFLLSVRPAVVTLTALPMSVLVALAVFDALRVPVNTMTLGGIAVAVGELVDDALVDVENVQRRLRENARAAAPRPRLAVVYDASREVRGPILIGTAVVLMVFVPLLALPGLEGRLFRPLAAAYLLSIAASLAVAVTLTPVLCSLLLRDGRPTRRDPSSTTPTDTTSPGEPAAGASAPPAPRRDGLALRACKALARRAYALTLPRPAAVILAGLIALAGAGLLAWRLPVEFLPPFNEGTATITITAPPGVTLEQAGRLAAMAEARVLQIPEVRAVGRRTGRAEADTHALGAHMSELEVTLWTPAQARAARAQPHAHPAPPAPAPAPAPARTPPAPRDLRPPQQVFPLLRAALADVPGVAVSVGQPISHRIEHLLTGVQAQIVIALAGDDLDQLSALARQARDRLADIPGLVDLRVQNITTAPHAAFEIDRPAAARLGFSPQQAVRVLSALTSGLDAGRLADPLSPQRGYPVVLTLAARPDHLVSPAHPLDGVLDVTLTAPGGALVRVGDFVRAREGPAPYEIGREQARRRIVVAANVEGRDLGAAVALIEQRLTPRPGAGEPFPLPPGVTLSIEGQHQAQRDAARRLTLLGGASLAAMFILLAAHYASPALALQIMLNVPFAFIGAVIALHLTGTPFSVAALVGFISLTGIAARNGVLMISHYLHLAREERVPFGPDLVIRASQERVAPVIMTALTSGIALLPIALAPDQPGREILHPVAVVVIGGLTTSTLLDFLITPAVFLRFGARAAQRHAAHTPVPGAHP